MTLFNYALVALGAVATASTSYTGLPASQGIDGNDVTYWQSTIESLPWYKVDLGTPQYITDLATVQADNTRMFLTANLEYSNDNSNWNIAGLVTFTSPNTLFSTGGITARYWRLTALTATGTTKKFHTVELRGPIEAPPPPENPTAGYIAAWLDGLEANYVPEVQDWLAAQ